MFNEPNPEKGSVLMLDQRREQYIKTNDIHQTFATLNWTFTCTIYFCHFQFLHKIKRLYN